MSKRLMAIQETFSSSLGSNQGPNHPLSLTRNGDVNKNQKCETNSSSSLPAVVPTVPTVPTVPAAPVQASSKNGWKPSTVVSPPAPAPASNPCKPNSLILVPNLPNHQNLGKICNGQVRLVSQARVAASKSAVEVQTEESPPPHVADCPYNTTKGALQSGKTTDITSTL